MSESQRSFASSRSRARPGARELTLRARLAIAFGLVTLLFAGAHYFGQRHTQRITARILESKLIKERFDRSALSLTDALAMEQQAVIVGAASPQLIQLAQAALFQAGKDYEALQGSVDATFGLPTISDSILEVQNRVAVLLAETKRNEDLLNRYWERFDRLQDTLAPQDSGWRLGDRVVTRVSSTELNASLQNVRNVVGAYLAAPHPTKAAAIGVAEDNFLLTIDRNASTLTRNHTQAWLQGTRSDFAQLRQRLHTLRIARSAADSQADAVASDLQSLSRSIRSRISEPATQALAASAIEASTIAQRADQRTAIAGLSILALMIVIAFLTVTSISGPIARLTVATQLLAEGDETARAPRGGMPELDNLAAAFNTMADHLSVANQALRGDHARLEDKVHERTQQLRRLAFHDALTQLPNRRHLFQHLTTLLEKARGTGQRVALTLLDLDNFKTLNDSLGHRFGDRVLKVVGERIVNAISRDSYVARLGGDEFTIVGGLAAASGDVTTQARALLADFERPLQVDGREIIVTVSIGVGSFPDHASDAESLLRAADAALFKAKAAGRNQLCVASVELVDRIGGEFKTEQALRRAMANQELELLFQPQVSLGLGQVTAVEALLRWKRGGVYVTPSDFLPLAEQSGLTGEITEWVLQQAVITLAQWHRGAWPHARIAVNISAQQFIDPTFVRKLQALLELHRVPPASLELELTENVLQSGTATVSTLRELRKLGVGIALDDFGAGFSSLASLQQLELSRVKIDRTLIEHVDSQARSASIARSMIGLCRSLNLEVTVEGIEHPEQLHFLRTCAAVDVQGFLFSLPLPAEQVASVCAGMPERLLQLEVSETRSVLGKASPPAVLQWRKPPRH